MSPLDRKETFKVISEAFATADDEILIAAPYFGKGAAVELGLDRTSAPITIVCDLFSGGCNPHEIEAIMALASKPSVKRLRGLHAKIYLTERAVVCGSANPSTNGLGFERSEVLGNIEACVTSSDPSVVAMWRHFFEHRIEQAADDVSAADIARAKPLFDANRKRRRRSDEATFLETMRLNRNALKDKPIFLVESEPTALASDVRHVLDAHTVSLGGGDIDYYADWHGSRLPSPGSFLVDFARQPSGGLKFNRIWRVFEEGFTVSLEGLRPLFVYRDKDVQGMAIPTADRQELQRLLRGQLATAPSAYEVAEKLFGHELVERRAAPLLTIEDLIVAAGGRTVIAVLISYEELADGRKGFDFANPLPDEALTERMVKWWRIRMSSVRGWEQGEGSTPGLLVAMAGPPDNRMVIGSLEVDASGRWEPSPKKRGSFAIPTKAEAGLDYASVRGRLVDGAVVFPKSGIAICKASAG